MTTRPYSDELRLILAGLKQGRKLRPAEVTRHDGRVFKRIAFEDGRPVHRNAVVGAISRGILVALENGEIRLAGEVHG